MTELNRTCVLIVESDVLIRNLISTILNNEGHLTLAAATNAEAMELSRTSTGEIRLLIARGSNVAGVIAAERPGIRVVLLSPYTSAALKEVARKVDCGVSVQMETLPRKLSDTIQRALTHPDFGAAFIEV